MKYLVALFIVVPSLSFACPNLTGKFNCRNQRAGTVRTLSSIVIKENPNGSLNVIENLVGIHDDSNGKITVGPYANSYDLSLGYKSEELTDESGKPFAKKRTSVTCLDEELISQSELKFYKMNINVMVIRIFSKSSTGSLIYINDGMEQAIACDLENH